MDDVRTKKGEREQRSRGWGSQMRSSSECYDSVALCAGIFISQPTLCYELRNITPLPSAKEAEKYD